MKGKILDNLKNNTEKDEIKNKLYTEFELFKISNLYSENDVIRALSCVVSSLISISGLKEEVQIYHRKNILMFIAAIFGIFGSIIFKFPESKSKILFCVVGFFITMLGTVLVDVYSPFPGHSCSYTIPSEENKNHSNFSFKKIWNYNQNASYISIKLDRPTNNIEFIIQKGNFKVTQSTYIGKLFTSDGYINTDLIFDITSKLIIDLYNTSNKKNN
ncbi:hypothetical protein FG386_000629 [Cryptosporidium ryanae]|uniref:uncharacterized protein n=1 Tax=Cryptosporidium ryanae TaxID=515981 RepID=UPI00351A0384|nr:hypothetical protein FG386_000629 [Cryptosporidium ryanae]